jgi:NADH:ubiquinone oxidoreductase subunit F (NADH-binding)
VRRDMASTDAPGMSAVALMRADAEPSELEDVPRLLAGPFGAALSLRRHLETHGPLPSFARHRVALIDAVEASGLTGRGGGGFSTATKLGAVANTRRSVVVANGTEGEPASGKDKALLAHNPHLVIDGVVAAAQAVGAREAIIAVGRHDETSRACLNIALAERRERSRLEIRVESAPDRFVSGEESALVNWLNGGPAKPTFTPPRPSERGVGGRPTLVQNVETLAHIALIARHGPVWFRRTGTRAETGSVLVTVGGCVRRRGVIEVAIGTPIRTVVDYCGGLSAPARALLIGGYFGSWAPARAALDAPLSNAGLRPLGASLGAGTIVVLPEGACGLAETARVARYLAGESAQQCGPCLFGLGAVAAAFESLAVRDAFAVDALRRIPRLNAQIAGRGACSHPDGAVRLARSALAVFRDEIDAHLAGRCTAVSARPCLPVPQARAEWE